MKNTFFIIVLIQYHLLSVCQPSNQMYKAFLVSVDSSINLVRKIASIDYGWEKVQFCYYIKITNFSENYIEYAFTREDNAKNIFAQGDDLRYFYSRSGDVMVLNNLKNVLFDDNWNLFTRQFADSLLRSNKFLIRFDFSRSPVHGNYDASVVKLKKIGRFKFEHTIRYYYQFRFTPPHQRPIKIVTTPYFRFDSTFSISDPVQKLNKYFRKGKVTPEYYEDRFVFKLKPL
jgi:hypothetical protein